MAIGTAAAIGLGVAGVGSFMGAKSQKKAANTAANTATQTADKNNALAMNIYGQNQAALSPYMQRGNVAGDQMNALLGLGGGGGSTGVQNLYSGANPGAAPTQGQNPQGNAFQNYLNSTGYKFRRDEGMNALNAGYAGAGVYQSGDAMRAAQEYGQNFASNEYGNYMGYLGNQQGVGLAGASALAGVGQNYANSVMANNNNAGSAVANAALTKGANNPFASILGTVGGGLLGGM